MRLVRLFAPLALLLALLVPAASISATQSPAASYASQEDPSVGQLREFQITVARTVFEVAPGLTVDAYSYNGQVPGPELRVTEGDTVRVVVTNALDEPTTVHWHGVELPLAMDGVPGLSQDPILPGGSFTYEFVATRAGTRWYHSHFHELAQQGSGLFGALIVEPREPAVSPPDREYTLFATEWVTAVLPALGDQEHVGHSMGGAGMGRPVYDTYSINGKTYAASEPLMVAEGQRVRLRLINAAAVETQRFALAGHRLTITHTDGNPLAQPLETDAVALGAGERVDVEFAATNPGRWQLRGLAPGHFAGGMAVDVVYEGHEADPVQELVKGIPLETATYLQMAGPPHPQAPDRVVQMVLSDQLVSGDFWTINGKRYPDTDPVLAAPGERIRLRLINESAEDHPMHLHGHTFQIVSANGQPFDGPLKDVVNVRFMEQYEIEFVAPQQPGAWLFHCHNIVHMGGGMTTEIRYQ